MGKNNTRTGYCPNCFNPIHYEEGAESVRCIYCDSHLSVSQLKDSTYHGGSNSDSDYQYNNSNITPANVIDTSESGLAYLEQYFELFDWDEYCSTTELVQKQILDLVDKNKYRNADNPTSWLLEFRSIATPLSKKIEGLQKTKQYIIDNFTGIDDTNLYSKLDIYSKTIDNILLQSDNIFKKLETDIKYYTRYKGDLLTSKNLSDELKELKEKISQLKPVNQFEDIKEISEAVSTKDREIKEEYALKGIDAEAIYKEAVVTYSFSDDQSKALSLFKTIKKYRKSEKFIQKINSIFNYNNEFYRFGGLIFTTKRDRKNEDSSFDMKTLEQKVSTPTFSLYEIVDGVPEEKPLVKNISYILSSYGNEIFYIELNNKICSFNVSTKDRKVLDIGALGDYVYEKGSIPFSKDGTKFFIKKKIKIIESTEKKGCFSSAKKKKEPVYFDETLKLNNFSILSVNMERSECTKVIDKIVDITDYSNDTIFYTVATVNSTKDVITTFNMLDINTKVSKRIIDHNCQIQDVTDHKIIYTLWNPNGYNKDLYVLDKETLETNLIETNIYNYFSTNNNKIFYTVGNSQFLPLFSNNFEGTERKEIMQNVENIFEIHAGWMYIIKGYYSNRLLIKMKEDGSSRHVICSDFKKIIKLINGFIYYLDDYDNLHIVRSDGCDDTEIAHDLDSSNIIIDNNNIYYLRKEVVDASQNENYSLYRMDLDGHNVRKIAFNILHMQEFDDQTIYYSYSDTCKYEIATPVSVDEYKYSHETYRVKKFISYNKITDEYNELLTLGLPAAATVDVKKKGCSRKTVKKEVKYTLLPKVIKYPKRGEATIGQVENERQAAIQAAQQNNTKYMNMNKGCSSSLYKKGR